MVAALDAISPGLGNDPEATMGAAREVCPTIIDGAKVGTLVQAVKREFAMNTVAGLSDEQAEQVITAVRESSWCG